MRNPIGYIALSLLAAAFAGCSSTDTGSTKTASGGQDRLTGALAKYNGAVVPLANACTWDSGTGAVTVSLAANELVQISVRALDKALLVNGATCNDTNTAALGAAVTTKIKSLAVGPLASALTSLDASNETVIIDVRNGTYALAAATSGGIAINLGSGGTDEVALLGAATADKFGCKQTTGKDTLGIKSATSGDVTFATVPGKFTVDLNDGDDAFDQGDCVTPMAIYGGAGKDTITASGTVTSAADFFSGGAGLDTLTYAGRLAANPVTVSLDNIDPTVQGNDGTGAEHDNASPDIETVIGSAGADSLTGPTTTQLATANLTGESYTFQGGAGDDTFVSNKGVAVIFTGGTGVDTVDYSARTGSVTVTMDGAKADDGETGDADNVGKEVENLVGSNNGDTVTGNALNNVFYAGTGNDVINGGAGDDVFVAQDSDGNDQFIGGTGIDTADYSARTASVCLVLDGVVTSGVFGGTHSGACTVTPGVAANPGPLAAPVWPGSSSTESDILGADVENAVGTLLDDHIIGNALSNTIYGMGGSDKLEGKAGDDLVDGNAYASTATYTCDPILLACRGTVNGNPACDCATTVTTWTPTCPHATLDVESVIDCGGDALDVGTCKTGQAGQYIGCWKTQ